MGSPSELARACLDLTRPRVLLLVVLTAVPALRGAEASRAFVILAAVGLLGAAASALNAVLDRDIDALMTRTRGRPLPSGRVGAPAATALGLGLAALALALLAAVGHPAALGWSLATLVVYVGVYTAWLKRRSAWNMLVGSLPGAAAPLIASAALHGAPTPLAWWLFAIVLAWQPPHFWAIGLFRREEYARAGVPMLVDRIGPQATRHVMLAFSALLWLTSLGPWAIGAAGPGYAALAVLLGAMAVGVGIRAVLKRSPEADRQVFFASLAHLSGIQLPLVLGF